MKKFLAIALIAASFVACNDAKKEESTTTPADSSAVTPPATPATGDTVKAVVTDTTKPAVDTTKH